MFQIYFHNEAVPGCHNIRSWSWFITLEGNSALFRIRRWDISRKFSRQFFTITSRLDYYQLEFRDADCFLNLRIKFEIAILDFGIQAAIVEFGFQNFKLENRTLSSSSFRNARTKIVFLFKLEVLSCCRHLRFQNSNVSNWVSNSKYFRTPNYYIRCQLHLDLY